MNKVILVGNLGRDPEMKTLDSGAALCKFSMATGRKYTTSDGQERDDTEWSNVIVWGRQADACGRYLTKGSKVCVEGRMKTRSWETDSGERRYMTEVVAASVEFLGTAGAGGSEGQPAARSAGTHSEQRFQPDDDDIQF